MIICKNKILADNIKYCNNIFSKSLGLRFRRRLKDNEALVFVNDKESYHESILDMLFVFFPIDVLWLDENKKVVDIRENVKPFSLFIRPKKPAKYVVELNKGTVKNIRINDTLKF
jgi:uncharacterized protein